MRSTETYDGGENFDLRMVLMRGKKLGFREKTQFFQSFLRTLSERKELTTMRCIESAADSEVQVQDPVTGGMKRMVMFGSNNYLGLANHPYIRERARSALQTYGAGIGGPPLLNGYTSLHRTLEERLAAFKKMESAMIFSSGYGANVGLVSALANPDDVIIYDAYSHASFCDGLKMLGAASYRFPHNDLNSLRRMLEHQTIQSGKEIFVGVEGVYSMDGDVAPLDALIHLCHDYGAILLLDDAHGTGVMGAGGRGTAEYFGVEGQLDVTMGTFSKVFAVTGGFVAASKPIIDYLRYFARPYMFSASLPPVIIATVLAGLDIIEREPERLTALRANVAYTIDGLRRLGIDACSHSGIIPLRIPVGMNIRRGAMRFHELGIFVNSVEYPAVPVTQQRFRISMMATHTRSQIDRLLEAVAIVWNEGKEEQWQIVND